MVTFVKPISFVALESLEVGHFKPEIQGKSTFLDFGVRFLQNYSDKFVLIYAMNPSWLHLSIL